MAEVIGLIANIEGTLALVAGLAKSVQLLSEIVRAPSEIRKLQVRPHSWIAMVAGHCH